MNYAIRNYQVFKIKSIMCCSGGSVWCVLEGNNKPVLIASCKLYETQEEAQDELKLLNQIKEQEKLKTQKDKTPADVKLDPFAGTDVNNISYQGTLQLKMQQLILTNQSL